jgi:Ala-tRNA(Pro) deacylase
MPTSPEDLLAYLAALGVETETVDHPPLHTVEDSQALRGDIPGGHTKNLFVKDKKSRLFLLVSSETTAIDLKRVAREDRRAGARFFRLGRSFGGGMGRPAGRGDAVRGSQRPGWQGSGRAG